MSIFRANKAFPTATRPLVSAPGTNDVVGNSLCMLLRKWLLVGCWSFTSWKHLRSYQDDYWLVIIHTHGVFVMLARQKTRPPAPWRDPTKSHYPDTKPTSSCPIPIMLSAWLGSGKYKYWFHSTSVQIPWSPKRETDAQLIRPPHPVWFSVHRWSLQVSTWCALMFTFPRNNQVILAQTIDKGVTQGNGIG